MGTVESAIFAQYSARNNGRPICRELFFTLALSLMRFRIDVSTKSLGFRTIMTERVFASRSMIASILGTVGNGTAGNKLWLCSREHFPSPRHLSSITKTRVILFSAD
jgi:hypothetical protein